MTTTNPASPVAAASRASGADPNAPLLEVADLHVEFHTKTGVAQAINGLNFTLHAGETLAILGESGSGKSVTAQAIMGILDMPPGHISPVARSATAAKTCCR